MRTVSIGNQSFESVITNDSFYVDKTGLIKEWWESLDVVTLITRPRRFGKTFNLDMLECFFSVKYKGRKDLFEKLSIWKDKKYHDIQGTYPVINMSFASVKGAEFKELREGIISAVSKAYEKHSYLKKSGVLNNDEIMAYDAFVRYINDISKDRNIPDQMLKDSIYRLSEYLTRYYGKKTIILLDEYDTPLQESYINGCWEELVEFIRGLFNCTFKENPYFERAIMTGITRVSKESIFSDLNNLTVVTSTSKKYAAYFGFTEQEVFAALDEAGLSEEKEEVKSWYDGFTFGTMQDIYNPWSITNFLDEREYKTYWADTSSNAFVNCLIQTGSVDIKEKTEILLEGKCIETQIDEQIVFNQLDSDDDAVWSMLLASGYLKVQKKEFDKENGTYTYFLCLTNKEVMLMMRKLIRQWFGKYKSHYNGFTKALMQGNIDDMEYFTNEIALNTFSMFDAGNKPSERTQPEKFYHGFVLGMMVDLREIYEIKSNHESGRGRYDIMMIPKKISDKNTPPVIIEFKVFDAKKESNLTETAQRALQQIEDMGYDAELVSRGIEKEDIRHYGFAFKGKEVVIGATLKV